MSWIAASFLVLAIALAASFAWYERDHPTTRVLALVATLAALAALGRVAFAPLPNVKPTTDIVVLSGYVLGGAPGFAVGAVAALASNVFFGQGPWTPWQMAGWGITGLMGAGLAAVAGRELGRVALAAACGAAGLVYGAIMNLSLWVLYSGDHTLVKLGALFVTSLPFDLAHVIGNVVFCLAFGPVLVRALERFRTRFEIDWGPVAPTGAAVLAVALALGAATAAPARAQTAADAAATRASERYLLRAQNSDGGWGAAPGQGSTALHTGWVALGLAAAGTNPLDAGRTSAVAYIRAHARDLRDLGAVERTILVLEAAGVSARDVGGRDLVRELERGQRRDGSFEGRVNTTAFGVLALRAAGRGRDDRRIRRAIAWIDRQANEDGGFNFAGRGGPSGIDDTGAALQALGAAGRRRSQTARAAASFLVAEQNRDGGFPLQPGGGSNAQSTAWAIQGLVASGRDPARVRRAGSRDPLAYLRSLSTGSGAVNYSRTSRQTPVWVTAQAVMALARKPLPLARVPRARRGAAPAARAPAATPAPTAAASPRPARRSRPAAPAAPTATPRPVTVAAAAPGPQPRALIMGATVAAASRADRARTTGLAAGLLVSLIV
jgi:energy-coupling factor transport system substrate-specific component